MRIWDLPVNLLCRNHLLGEHRELHAIWNILTTCKKGYANHPETKRWVNKLAALYKRHEEEVIEMEARNFHHHSPLNNLHAVGNDIQRDFLNSLKQQKKILRDKICPCFKK